MPRFVSSALCLLVLCSPVTAQHLSPHAKEAAQTIKELRTIGMKGSPETGPPAKVPALLRQLNQQLRELTVDTLNDRSRRNEVASEEEIMDQLRQTGWEEIPDHKWQAHGEIIRIKFDWNLGYDPGLLVVSTQLWIPCGSSDPDAMIYVFQGKGREWQLQMVADADFDSWGDSSGKGMEYKISRPDSRGAWFLAVAHTPPSCRGFPDNLKFTVLRKGKSPDEPQVLFNLREPVSREFDPRFRLDAEEDWFAVTRGKVRKLDGMPAAAISRYSVAAQKIERIPPLADDPVDFLDQWAQLNWDDAGKWSDASHLGDIRAWHSRLGGLEKDSTEVKAVEPCPKQRDEDSTWVVHLWIDHQLNPSIREQMVYATLSKRNSIFYVNSIGKEQPAFCPGEAPPRPRTGSWLPDW